MATSSSAGASPQFNGLNRNRLVRLEGDPTGALTPLEFLSISFVPDDQWRLEVSGQAGQGFEIESSLDMEILDLGRRRIDSLGSI